MLLCNSSRTSEEALAATARPCLHEADPFRRHKEKELGHHLDQGRGKELRLRQQAVLDGLCSYACNTLRSRVRTLRVVR